MLLSKRRRSRPRSTTTSVQSERHFKVYNYSFVYCRSVIQFGMINDEYRRWSVLRTESCNGHAPFNEQIYGMIVIWEITKDDADRFNLPDTEALALAGEWALERLRPHFSLFREEAIAGENAARDHVYADFADKSGALKKKYTSSCSKRYARQILSKMQVFSSARIVSFLLQKLFRQSAVSFHIALKRLHAAAICIIINGLYTKASSMFTI